MQASYRISSDNMSKNILLFPITGNSGDVLANMYWFGQSNVYQCYLQTTRDDIQIQYDGTYSNVSHIHSTMQTPVLGQFLRMRQNTKYFLVESGADPTVIDLRYSLDAYNSYVRLDNLNLTSYDNDETIAMDFRAGCIAGELNARSMIIMTAIDNEFNDIGS